MAQRGRPPTITVLPVNGAPTGEGRAPRQRTTVGPVEWYRASRRDEDKIQRDCGNGERFPNGMLAVIDRSNPKGYRVKAKIVAAALGLGIVVGSLVGGTQAGAAPGGGAKSSASKNYACDCQTMVVTSSLNLRKGPSTNDEILYVMPKGLKVQMDLQPGMHQNGFAHISWDEGENYGWASEDY